MLKRLNSRVGRTHGGFRLRKSNISSTNRTAVVAWFVISALALPFINTGLSATKELLSVHAIYVSIAVFAVGMSVIKSFSGRDQNSVTALAVVDKKPSDARARNRRSQNSSRCVGDFTTKSSSTTWVRRIVACLAVSGLSIGSIASAQAGEIGTGTKLVETASTSTSRSIGAAGVSLVDKASAQSILPAAAPSLSQASNLPILDPIVVDSAAQGTEFIITGLEQEPISATYKLDSGSVVQITNRGQKYGTLAAPFAVDDKGSKVKSTYRVKNGTVS